MAHADPTRLTPHPQMQAECVDGYHDACPYSHDRCSCRCHPVPIPPCETCMEVALEEGADKDIAATLLIELGADLPDHRCEFHDDSAVRCCCSCTRR